MNRTVEALKTDTLFNLSRTFNRSLIRPDWVSINLTLRCNLHCTMCTTCYDVPDELSRTEILDIIDQVSAWGVRILNPLGGEPFVRDDIIEILEYACQKDFYITLTTNGTLITPEHARGIARIAYDRLHFNFSIDGFKEVHDKVRGPGMLERTLQGLSYIREADQAAGNPPRKIQVNSVVNNQNLEAIPAFLEYCRAQGFQGVQLLNLFKKEGHEVPREIKHLWIHRERWPVLDRVVEEVLAYKRDSDPQAFAVVNTEHELEIMKLYYRGQLPPRNAKCYAGWKELYINADGHAIMCDGHLDFLKGQFGDVRQQTLQEMWESQELKERRAVVKACESPCIQDCYLRETSDSLITIAKEAGTRLWQEVKKRLPQKPGQWVPLPGSQLTLELSDVADVNPAHEINASSERFDQLLVKLPADFARCYQDPFEYYDMRNRGYLNFNRGFMGFELVKRFVPDLERAGVRMDRIRLGYRGDPLLHPEYVLIYRYLLERARQTGVFGEIRVDTHATLLNTEYVDLAIGEPNVPQTFFVVLDAATPETYAALNGKDLFQTVLDRLDYLIAMKARHQADHVRLVLVFTALEANAHEAVAFRELWSSRLTAQGLPAPRVAAGELPEHPGGRSAVGQGAGPGDERVEGAGRRSTDLIYFRRRDDDNFLAQLASKEVFQRVAAAVGHPEAVVDRDNGRAPRCAAPFKTPTITWDGKVTVCDQDRFLKLKVGEVTTEDLAEIWWKKGTSRDIREAVERGELHQRTPCRDCRQPFSPNAPTMTDEELGRYFKMTRLGGWSV